MTRSWGQATPLTWDEAHDKQFTPTRLRPGYKVEQADAFLG